MGQGQFVLTCGAKIDESDPPFPITKLAPLSGPLAQAAVTVHPDVEWLLLVGVSFQKASICSNFRLALDIP